MRKQKVKKIRVGFDLDGVVINKPPFVPKFIMEFLVRDYKNKKLSYRFPKSKIERMVRITSHHPVLRPPIDNNAKLIKELASADKYELFVVSSRYSFLENRTRQWFEYHQMNHFFENIYINEKDEQPHLFKERMIKKLNLNVFIDDDLPLLNYLKTKLKNVDLLYMEGKFELDNK